MRTIGDGVVEFAGVQNGFGNVVFIKHANSAHETVYAHLRSVKHRLPQLPAAATPHWMRHTHATALLLAGTPVHVVSRRLGHESVQTTMNTYGHVTEDAELEALANWREVVAGWEANRDGN